MRLTAAVLIALAGSALAAQPAHAQDSVSTGNGLPGDAPSAYQAGTDTRQVLRYIVDLAPKTSSWAGQYAIGPVVKASRPTGTTTFDQLIGAQAASARFGSGALASSGNYLLWTGAPGQGVNPTSNTLATQSVWGTGLVGQRFGLGFMEFGPGLDAGFGTPDDENNLIGALVDFQFRAPNRLFVQRTVAATNKNGTGTGTGTASFGLGGIDEQGNMHVYADGYGMTSNSRLLTRALLRIKLPTRTGSLLNHISGSGSAVLASDAPALDAVRTGSTMVTVPGIISASLSGGAGRPVLLASDLLNNYVFESAANSTSTSTAYLNASATSPRGSVAFIPQVYSPVAATASPIGTAATLARTDSNTKTRAVQVFGVGASGVIGTAITVALPSTAGALTDGDDGFAPGNAFSPITNHEFTNYASQASFRGSTSQVAMVQLSASGDLLVAASVAATGGGGTVPQSQDGYIAVARLPATGGGGSPPWTIAAHTGAAGFAGPGAPSKAIYSRPTPTSALTPIGRLARYTEVFGSSTTGPSISCPAFDAAGNVYFMATIGLTGTTTTFTTGLLKANFNSASNTYQLELIASVGDILPGLNSGRNYQVQFMGLADADSIDSGSIFSSATVRDSIAGVGAATTYGSPLALGALVFRAKIVYDINADTLFADPSGVGSTPTSPDQAYNVAMVLMPRIPRGDFNRDQQVGVNDIFAFLAAWFASSPGADWGGNGAITVTDIFEFLTDWFAGG